MTDPLKPPIITPIDAAADAIDNDDDSHLPAHEVHDESTAADPGTGTIEADDSLEEPDNPDEVVPTSHLPG